MQDIEVGAKEKTLKKWDKTKQGIFKWNHQIRLDVEDSISFATSYENFLKLLELKGYGVSQKGGEAYLKPMGEKRFIRLADISAYYTKETLEDRLDKGIRHELIPSGNRTPRIISCRKIYRKYIPLSPYQKAFFAKMYRTGQLKYHCDDFIRTLTNGTIVYSYVCQIKCIVSQAFDYACDREIMSWNFMRKVKINEDRCKEHEDKELGVWEDDEINILQSGSMNCWNKCRKYRNSPALFILCGTGLRLGELLALKWSKVDFERRTIRIERTQTEYTDYDTNSKIYEESTPKNKTSRRTIVINDFTYKWLMEQKRRTKQAGIESEYVIPANSGRMVKESNITSTFKVFCNNVGVEYKPSHTCRRSYVTNCLDKDMKLALVSRNVGHKNKSTTLNTYYKCKNDYEDNLAIQNEIFKIYDFDFGGVQKEFMFA
ncbi:hypothetical protein C819_00593 [Lachnospiraceae bacterium 10-1]|nr:hypothetical protein C819_00593 [Lachnospiraceae bacterium 10-1]